MYATSDYWQKAFFKSRDWHKITHQLLSHLPLMFSRHINLNTYNWFHGSLFWCSQRTHTTRTSAKLLTSFMFPHYCMWDSLCETPTLPTPNNRLVFTTYSTNPKTSPGVPQSIGATVCFCGIDWTAAWPHCFHMICVSGFQKDNCLIVERWVKEVSN